MAFQDPSGRLAALSLLHTAVGDPDATFREGQWEAIDTVVNARERLLVVEHTGWGKSSVYFKARVGHLRTVPRQSDACTRFR